MKDQGTINPHDTLVDNLFDTQVERLSTLSEDKKPKGQGKCSKFLKYASFGQYRTPLYYRQNEFYSSKTGGIITLICGTLFTAYSIYLLVVAFQGYEKLQEEETQNFYYLNYTISKQDQCDSKDQACVKLTIEQFINAYADQDPIYCITFNDTYWHQLQDDYQCQGLSMGLVLDFDDDFSIQYIRDYDFRSDSYNLQCCSTSLNATNITQQLKKKKVDVSENVLYKTQKGGALKGEYLARVNIKFYGLDESNTLVVNMGSIKRFSVGGMTQMNVQAPYIPYQSYTKQKLSFINYNEYFTGIYKYFYEPDLIKETFQYISQSSNNRNSDVVINKLTQLAFDVQAEQIKYVLYPSGLVLALTKIGGLLAILKISIVINFLHRRWFEKEINEEIASNQIAKDEEEGQQSVNTQNLYSIENFNSVLQRLKQVEEELKQLKLGKKDD